jgi:hypothetical protein
MNGRQIIETVYVLREDRKGDGGQLSKCLSPPDAWVADIEIALHALDKDLPIRGCTDEVGSSDNRAANFVGEPSRIGDREQRYIRIE